MLVDEPDPKIWRDSLAELNVRSVPTLLAYYHNCYPRILQPQFSAVPQLTGWLKSKYSLDGPVCVKFGRRFAAHGICWSSNHLVDYCLFSFFRFAVVECGQAPRLICQGPRQFYIRRTRVPDHQWRPWLDLMMVVIGFTLLTWHAPLLEKCAPAFTRT